MRLTYKYQLKPNKEQITTFEKWLDLCRRQYNFRLGQRFTWYEQTRSRIDACPLTCSIIPVEQIYSSFPTEKVLSKGKRKGETLSYFGNNGYLNWADIQKDDLPNTKKLFPEYKQLHSQVLQDVIARVEYAFSRFLFPDKNGKTSGRPRFKGKYYYKSFTYAQMSRKDIYRNNNARNVVKLSKIGEVELVLHRKIPNGFSVKTGTVIKEADGWYISLVLEDKNVPDIEVAAIHPTEKNSIGIDLGLEFYAALSTSKVIENPRFLRISSQRLAKLQQKLSQRKKHSKPWQIIKRKIAKLHQKIKRQRLDFQFKTAYQLFEKYDVLILEDLTLKNLIRRNKPKIEDGKYVPNNQAQKSGLNRSLCDAGHGNFVKVLEFIAWKLGKSITFVDPRGTSQHCNSCLNKVSKSLSDRWHDCTCGENIARDINSAKLIKRLGTEGTDIASLKKRTACSQSETVANGA